MRVLVKGGVWKNSEDEILKAAIMKYGKNEWGRVASLLPRKTAKQCKRRWNEWLDPMIKKTEWTREEDEKLLHLAKIMPTQWRTIAPLIGRTPRQCLERYGKLLDQAAGTDEKEAEEARKLQAGEVDANPENKPARPDPVHMDEDENEMLSEAKARLANVNGKKAKRKARERLLENARRMAKLQKYRELKAAGVSRGVLDRRRQEDEGLADEIPFERAVPTGFYDTSGEVGEGLARLRSSESKLLEAANREARGRGAKEREAMERDRKRFEKLAETDLEAAMKEIDRRNAGGGAPVVKRAKLSLPTPQVGDAELEDIARLGRKRRRDARPVGASSSSSSSSSDLMGDYVEQPLLPARASALLRTPMAPDVVLEEARNQRRRTNGATPLAGGDSIITTGGTGFEGHAPSVAKSTTTAPSSAARSAASGTSSFAGVVVRDQLNINEEDVGPSEALVSRQEALERQKEAAERLRAQLGALPAPKYSYEVDFVGPPAAGGDDEDDGEGPPVDASEREAAEKRKRDAARAAELEQRSEVAKRGLPMPETSPPAASGLSPAEALVRAARDALVNADAEERGPETRPAAALRKRAADRVAAEARAQFGTAYSAPDLEALAHALRTARAAQIWVPNEGWRAIAEASTAQQVLAAQEEFRALGEHQADATKAVRSAERKTGKLVLELQARAEKATAALAAAQADLERATREAGTFSHMMASELASIPARLAAWRERLERVQGQERELQTAFYENR